MNVTIIGTGNMARGIGSRLVAGGHEVTVLGKEASDAEAAIADIGGNGSAASGRFGDEPDGDVVVLAVYYPDARDAVERYGEALSGKVVVDITNPINESFDLVTPPDSSAAQELAKLAPGARLVKAFNTTFANTLRQGGEVSGQPLDVFIASDDDEAKATVGKLVEDGGLRPVDVGPLKRARELEATGLVHMSVQDTLGTGFTSALKVVG